MKIENVNLVRKLAWSFYFSTGIDYEELYSEGLVAYYTALNSYEEGNGTKLTSWIYACVKNALISFTKRELKQKNITGIEEWATVVTSNPDYEFYETITNLPEEVKSIVEMVKENKERYILSGLPPKYVLGLIRKDLREQRHWSYARINHAMRELRGLVNS